MAAIAFALDDSHYLAFAVPLVLIGAGIWLLVKG